MVPGRELDVLAQLRLASDPREVVRRDLVPVASPVPPEGDPGQHHGLPPCAPAASLSQPDRAQVVAAEIPEAPDRRARIEREPTACVPAFWPRTRRGRRRPLQRLLEGLVRGRKGLPNRAVTTGRAREYGVSRTPPCCRISHGSAWCSDRRPDRTSCRVRADGEARCR